MARRPVIGVMGSGSAEHALLAEPLGRWIAEQGYDLLTGGGRGVMEAVSRAFHGVASRQGRVIGIVPGEVGRTGHYRAHAGYPNRWVEVAILTHLPLSGPRGTDPMSRNHINVLSSHVVVVLPGGAGTLSEVSLALRYERPLVALLGPDGSLPGLPDEVPVARSLAEVARFVDETLR